MRIWDSLSPSLTFRVVQEIDAGHIGIPSGVLTNCRSLLQLEITWASTGNFFPEKEFISSLLGSLAVGLIDLRPINTARGDPKQSLGGSY